MVTRTLKIRNIHGETSRSKLRELAVTAAVKSGKPIPAEDEVLPVQAFYVLEDEARNTTVEILAETWEDVDALNSAPSFTLTIG